MSRKCKKVSVDLTHITSVGTLGKVPPVSERLSRQQRRELKVGSIPGPHAPDRVRALEIRDSVRVRKMLKCGESYTTWGAVYRYPMSKLKQEYPEFASRLEEAAKSHKRYKIFKQMRLVVYE